MFSCDKGKNWLYEVHTCKDLQVRQTVSNTEGQRDKQVH